MSNNNRNRGDYLERQAKRSLEADGWFVIRAAGSHGIADLVALEARHAPILVSCKTNGTVGPAERAELCETAERAGARALLATRTRRGWISFYRVYPDGVGLLVDELRVPERRG